MAEVWRTVNGLAHMVVTRREWEHKSEDSRGVITDSVWTGWPVGTLTMLHYDPKHGTCLVPVLIEG